MIDTKNSISVTLYSFFISFLFLVALLYLLKPSWIQIVILKNNKKNHSISWLLLLSYSLTFSLVCAITALLFCTSTKSNTTSIIQKSNYFVSSFL